MIAQTAARAKMLANIRAMNAEAGVVPGGYGDIERQYRQGGSLAREAVLQLMMERLREYDAEVVECAPERLAETIAMQIAASGRKIFVAPQGLDRAWMTAGYEWRVDGSLPVEEIEAADGVVTGSCCGVAESGTIVLHHDAGRDADQGRRVLTLLPDWHLCVLRASTVVETLPEYFARCAGPPRLATYISGPSATADIEMTRIKGVHGPRFLNVVMVHD